MAPRRISIVAHTHWDREWYEPFQTFRLRLVHLIDNLLDLLESDPSYSRFLLDGQMAVVDDYLEIRPENEERIRALAAAGRLSMGPWYILMDEFLVSGETIIRDLQAGMGRGAAFGGATDVGYLPDMFGHIGQMPQILKQAGFENAVVWRGVPSVIDKTGFVWEAPDGSTVRAEYLPVGYGNGAAIPTDAKELVRRVADHEKEIGSFLIGGLLFMDGTDHQEPQPWLGRVVAEANALQDDYVLEVTALADYLAGAPTEGLERWKGELRSGARANVLMGVASNRVDVKIAAARAERALERRAEPYCALYLPAGQWPQSFFDVAWKEMIRNAAHDSVCACSVDEVVDAVLTRYAEGRQIGEGLADQALVALSRSLAEAGPVVVNPSARPRGGIVENGGGRRRHLAPGHPSPARGARRFRDPSGTRRSHPRRLHGADHPRDAPGRRPDRRPHLDPGRPGRGGRDRDRHHHQLRERRALRCPPGFDQAGPSIPGWGPGPTRLCASGSTNRRSGRSWPGCRTSPVSGGPGAHRSPWPIPSPSPRPTRPPRRPARGR